MENNKRLLIVDDDKEFLEELAEMLKTVGYNLVTVNDANQAVNIARYTKPDLIILDLKMPGKSGFQLAGEMKETEELKNIPIVAMSAHYKESKDGLLMDVLGIKKCLNKSLSPFDMLNEIEQALA